MRIKAGDTAYIKHSRKLSIAEDETPLLSLQAGDRVVATDEPDAQGFQTFIHIASGFENIRLHRDDLTMDIGYAAS